MRFRIYFLLPALIFLTVGCGGNDRTLYHVHGTITFDGQPVPAGAIFFEPDAAGGNDGTQGYAEIKNGRYDTSDSEKGITGGAYHARIRGFVPPGGDAPAKVLFKDYRHSLQLPQDDSQQDISVPPEAATGEETAGEIT